MRLQHLGFAIVLLSCNTAVPMSSSSSELPSLSITTDGGITGRGKVTATLQQKSCSAALTDTERRELQKLTAIHDSKAEGHGSPDQIRYTLTSGDHSASWFGEEAPADVAPLFHLLWRIRQRVLGTC